MKCFSIDRISGASRLLGLLAVVVVLAGCQSGPVPEVHYYLLQPGGNGQMGAGSVGVEGVRLPAYLQTSNIVLGVSDAELHPAQYHRWSEPLEEGIRRVVNAGIAARLAGGAEEQRRLGIDLEIVTFHGTQAGELSLVGTWKESTSEGKSEGFRIAVGLQGDGYAELVRAHVAALDVLAEQMVRVISER